MNPVDMIPLVFIVGFIFGAIWFTPIWFRKTRKEAIRKYSCKECKWINLEGGIEPCESCFDFNKWEADDEAHS